MRSEIFLPSTFPNGNKIRREVGRMTEKQAERGADGKFVIRFSLPDWLVRKIVLEVRAAKEAAGREVTIQ